ncbi:MAG: TRAFAC clade GTPase domain-containing protein, partial [Phycisphaerae bacterium]
MYASTLSPSTACLICDRENSPGSILCGGCAAPMALVHATEAAQRPPRLVTILGDSNVGKTVYLGFLLDMLTQRANGFEAIPRGAQSIELSQLVISHLAWRMFPPKTAMEADTWKWSYFEVCKRGRKEKWVDLITPDLAGEAIAAEVSSPTTFTIIQKLLDRTAGIMLLVDAAAAANGSAQPDFFALKMLSYVDALGAARKSKKIDTPVAIVLTKADYVPECFEQPRRFAEANLNRLWNLCESRLSRYEFFATSVVGSLGYAVDPKGESAIPVPLHTSLRGVLEPFEWIVNQ